MAVIDAQKTFWRGLCAGMHAIPTITPSEWAERHRIVSRGASARPGRFRCDPFQRAPMDAAIDPTVSEVALCLASQTAGKTEIIFNLIGYFADADPSPQLYVGPTDKLVADYSKERLAPMIRDTPTLAAIIAEPRSRDSGNTVLSKVYPGGSIALVGSNAPAGLAGRPRRCVYQDEVDRFAVSAGREGDPSALADRRSDSFPNAVKYKASTPTRKGHSRIWALLEKSDRQHWFAVCPRCHGRQVFAWAQVEWPKDRPEDATIRCTHCAAQLTDAERVAAVRAGDWEATQPFRGIRGYWLNGINTLSRTGKGFRSRLHQMVAEFLDAKDDPEKLRTWINTFLCEPYEVDEGPAITPDELIERGEEYHPDEIPTGVLLLTAGVDVQNDRIECEIVGYGRDEESWGIEKKVFDGNPEQDEVWQNLDAFLLSDFTRADRLPLKVERVFIDMQSKTKRVLDFCAPRIARGVYPCRGYERAGSNPPPLLPAKPSRNNRRKIPHWNVGVRLAKTTIYDRIGLPLPGPRSMHFPHGHGYDADHFRQLTCEKRRTRHSHGVAFDIFEKAKASDRNEALDLRVYAYGALISLGRIRWDKLAANRLKAIPPPDEGGAPDAGSTVPTEPTPPTAPARAARPVRAPRPPRRNFVNAW